MARLPDAQRKEHARRLAQVLLDRGAIKQEIDFLIGLASAESDLNPEATGPQGETGWWQQYTGTPPGTEDQAVRALAQLRELIDTIPLHEKEKWYTAIDGSWRARQEMFRVAWQLGRYGPAKAIRAWLAGKDGNDKLSVAGRWRSMDLRGQKLPGESDDDARLRLLLRAGKLGAADFIDYAARALGADRQALESGLNTFRRHMDGMNWEPTRWAEFKEFVYRDEAGGATEKAGGEEDTWLAKLVKSTIAGVKGGLRVLVGETVSSVLPVALLVLGAGAGIAYVRRLWQLGSKGR